MKHILFAGALGAAALSAQALAASAPAPLAGDDDGGSVEQVIVTGTRVRGLTATDSPAPVQFVDAKILEKTSATPDLNQTLAANTPSLTVATTGGDLASLTLQAALRSLSPNDTLVLINGKRRHGTANVNVTGTDGFGGGAGADLNLIPANAIDHVEVLTDGAAAQYGSDAIGGVVNIILKQDREGGNLRYSYGGYADGGGVTHDYTAHVGFEPFDGAYFNLTGEYRSHGHTVRSAALAFVQTLQNGLPTNGQYAGAGLRPIDLNAVNAPGFPFLNQISGDAEYQLEIGSFNSGFRLGDDTELYSFGTVGNKTARANQNYRLPHIAAYTPAGGTTQYYYPFGFTPLETIKEVDYALTAGLRGALAGWKWDLSSSYGRDVSKFYTENSVNTTAFARGVTDTATGYSSPAGYSPSDFYDGYFKATQWTTNLDVDREFEVGLAGPLNVAAGLEHRRDAFATAAGVPLSYLGGGGAAFAGFSPTDAGAHSRSNKAAYVDFAAKVTSGLRLDVAGRYERYSDFGSASSGKLTARYDFTPAFALRGTFSNGFRAPTVAEEYYTKTSTTPTSTGVQLAANSPAAALFGLGSLQPETSVSLSLGAVFKPSADFSASLDAYRIKLNHRIASTQSFFSLIANSTNTAGVQQPAYALVTQALQLNGNQLNPAIFTDSVNFFANGVNSRTTGVDLVLDLASHFDSLGTINWSLNANYNKTEVTDVRATPPALAALGLTVLDPAGFTGLSTGQPKYHIQAGALWTRGKLSINAREIVHDTNSVVTSVQANGVQTLFTSHSGVIPITNLDVAYELRDGFRLGVGAVNLLNRYPSKRNPLLLAAYQANGQSFAATQYPASPIGINGGYYYVKAAYNF